MGQDGTTPTNRMDTMSKTKDSVYKSQVDLPTGSHAIDSTLTIE